MAYIGKSIESGTFSVLDTSGNTYNGSNTTFNLGTQVGAAAQLLVSHDGVIQKPGTDYSLASGGTQITFTTAPASGASIFIVEISGAVGGPLDSDLNGAELILDADGDTSITADTDDQIDIKIANSDSLRIKANEIENVSGDLTVDVAGDIILDAAGEQIRFHDAGTLKGFISMASDNITLKSETSDTDILFQGNDGGSAITALTLDMSAGGDLTLGANANIVFPATNVVSTNANTLDDYEEGSFTPTVTADSVAYDNRTGRYTKVGNKVFVECLVQWNSASFASATGKLTVTGLPFTPIVIHYHGTYGTAYISSVNTNNVDGVAVLNVIASANDSSAVELIVYNNDAGGSYVKNDNNGDGVFSFCITYRTTA